MFRNRHRTSLVLLGLLWVASGGLAFCYADTLEIGSPAPDFRLPGVAGKTYSLDTFRDAEILVVVFTCNHCPTAQAYENRIKQLVTDYKAKKVAVVVISPNDPKAVRLDELGYSDLSDGFEEMKRRAKDHGFNFPYLYDGEDQRVSRAYGPVATPHVFVSTASGSFASPGGSTIPKSPSEPRRTTLATPSTPSWLESPCPWRRPRSSAARSSGPKSAIRPAIPGDLG